MGTDQEKVNPGSQGGDDTITIILPMSYEDHARLVRACGAIAVKDERTYSVHDAICDSVSAFIEEVERCFLTDGADEEEGGAA